MSTSLSPPQYPKRNFLCSLGIIIAVIGVSEMLVMLLLDATYQWGVVLSPLQGTVFNIILLTVLSSPLLWLLAIRPPALQVDQEQTTSNRELLDALENHVLLSITDVQGRIVYANDMFCKVSGYTQNELTGAEMQSRLRCSEPWSGRLRGRRRGKASASAPYLHPAGNDVDADFQLMTHDLTQATMDLVDNLRARKEQNQ